MTHSDPRQRRTFRPEVQALRALAVLLVVVYHFEPRLVPGGFVGVDVFFVISGFLITGHLLREAAANGRIDLPAFWAGRVRRILPAALCTVCAVVVLTLVLAPVTLWDTIARQALGSVFSVQNWVLAAESVDYLSAEDPPTALQHFWSLAVEEQFYLVWPLLVGAAALVAARRGRRAAGRRVLRAPGTTAWALAFFAVVTAASLAYSVHLTAAGDPAAYFVTPTRVWELGIGGILAALMWRGADGSAALPVPPALCGPTVRSVLALAGLAGIGYAAFAFDGATPFPGTAAAVPVLGTAAVILAGRTSGALSLHRVVDLPPVQWVGDVSFSLYLWHWPALVFFALWAGGEPGPLDSLGLLLLSFLLAAASHRFIETPARRFRPLAASTTRALVAGTAAVALAAAIAVVPGLGRQAVVAAERDGAQQLLAAPPEGFGAASMDDGGAAYVGGSLAVLPVPADAGLDRPELGRCVQEPDASETVECEFGDPDATTTIALVGDSHAAHWYEAVSAAAEAGGWKLVTYLKNSCPFTGAVRRAELGGAITCSQPNARTLERILGRGDIDAVVTGYWSGAAFDGDASGGFADYWGRIEDAGIEVYPIVATPRPDGPQPARDCVVEHAEDPRMCGTPMERAFEPRDWTIPAARLEPRVRTLDFSDQFCVDGYCPAVVGNVLVYRDRHHISDTYMRTLAPVFAERLTGALRMDGLLDGRGGGPTGRP